MTYHSSLHGGCLWVERGGGVGWVWGIEAQVTLEVLNSKLHKLCNASLGKIRGDGAARRCETVLHTAPAMTSLALSSPKATRRCRFRPTSRECQQHSNHAATPPPPPPRQQHAQPRQDGAWAKDVPAWYSQEDRQGTFQLQPQQECRCSGQPWSS